MLCVLHWPGPASKGQTEAGVRVVRENEARPGILARLKGLGEGLPDHDLATSVDRYLYAQDDHA